MTGPQDEFNPALFRKRSLPELLTLGADSRCSLDPVTGLNKYGCSPLPRPDAVPLGSCTSSSISQGGFDAAARALRRLQALDKDEDMHMAINEAFENVRADCLYLLTRLRVAGTELVLMPSGTDAEYLCLLLAMGPERHRVCNIVIGPREVGSGTTNSAEALYFDELVPSGEHRDPGAPIDEEVAERVLLQTVPVRDAAGRPRPEEEIDAQVASIAAAQVAAGRRVLLHVVAHNKTGMHAPSLVQVEQLKRRFGDDLLVVVDAAQGRFSRRGLVEILRKGYMVIVTGSKFYGGPPFAGGVLIPPNLNPVAQGIDAFPPGMGDFLTQAQVPTAWTQLRASLPRPGNPGLLLRWEAALSEIRDYYATPSQLRLRVLRTFEALVPEIISGSPFIDFDTVDPLVISDDTERLLESKTTVFPFTVKRPDSDHGHYNKAELTRIYHWLNDDCSALAGELDPTDRRDLAPKFHIGQPVAIGRDSSDGPAVLRIALGGVLLSEIAQNLARGDTIEQRFEWLEDQLIAFRRKLEVLAANYPVLAAEESSRQGAQRGAVA